MLLPSPSKRLPRDFYDREPVVVARQLLGKSLLRRLDDRWIGGRIVETEAYLSADDLASHSARGKRNSNAAMFGPPGTLYVYPIHAKYCMNAVTQREGIGSAILIRAIEPIWGIEEMSACRGIDDPRRLTRGPAMLCQALQVDRTLDAADLVDGDNITIADDFDQVGSITESSRIGISSATELQLRFLSTEIGMSADEQAIIISGQGSRRRNGCGVLCLHASTFAARACKPRTQHQ